MPPLPYTSLQLHRKGNGIKHRSSQRWLVEGRSLFASAAHLFCPPCGQVQACASGVPGQPRTQPAWASLLSPEHYWRFNLWGRGSQYCSFPSEGKVLLSLIDQVFHVPPTLPQVRFTNTLLETDLLSSHCFILGRTKLDSCARYFLASFSLQSHAITWAAKQQQTNRRGETHTLFWPLTQVSPGPQLRFSLFQSPSSCSVLKKDLSDLPSREGIDSLCCKLFRNLFLGGPTVITYPMSHRLA